MKKILFLVTCLSLPLSVFAGTEEDECFKLLDKAIKQDTRFQDSRIFENGDLSKVLYDESNSSYYDFSSYNNFRNKRVINPRREDWESAFKYTFPARRNNIGTIISPDEEYVISQISGFWRDSNFDFPLTPKSWPSFWDPYVLKDGFFKEYVLYTHHINTHPYDLLSCGIVKVTPLDGRSFSEISESWYMTNVITGSKKQSILWDKKCSSGFEWEKKKSWWEDFYKMKANICVQAYDESDYLKMEVISIAYDNDSDILNEYETHPIQVKAMKDHKNHADGLKWIQDEFRNDLYSNTCFHVVHGSSLPDRCDDEETSFLDSLRNILLPVGYARFDEELKEWQTYSGAISVENMKPMQAYEGIPYPLYRKLESIPDEKFRSYMLLSILPNFDTVLEHRQAWNVLLSPFEEVFLACDMPYERRLANVLYFLENLEVDDFSLSTLDYLDESYGNCVIPYPDKDVMNTVVEWSFESNVLLAEKLSWLYNEWDIPKDVQEYVEARQKILNDYNANLEDLESQYNKWEISAADFQTMFEENENQLDTKIQELNERSQKEIESTMKQVVDRIDSYGVMGTTGALYIKIVFIVILLTFWVLLVYFGLIRKKNHNNK